MSNEDLDLFVLYNKPSDYPDFFVVRKHTIKRGGHQVVDNNVELYRSLDEVVLTMRERGLIFLDRRREDDAVIIGTFL